MANGMLSDKALRAGVERAKQHQQRLSLTVGGVPGLQARLGATGEVSYGLRYRRPGARKQKVLVFKAEGLGEAREHARDLLATARRATVGKELDPWQQKQAEKAAEKASGRTLENVIKLWLASPEAEAWRPGTRYQFGRICEKDIIPVLGECDPATIPRGDIRKLLDDIKDGVGRKRKAPSEAHHAQRTITLVYNWMLAERQEHLGITLSPCLGLEATKQKPRSRTYSNDEIRRIFAAVGDGAFADLVGVFFHCGTRDEETRAMRWADIDLDERRLWTIPANISKNDQPHMVALSSGARAILQRIRDRKVSKLSPFVFPAGTKRGYMGRPLSDVFRDVSIEAGLLQQVGTAKKPRYAGDRLRLHDIRRTVGDRVKQEHGAALMHAILGHSEAMLTKTYGPTPPLKQQAAAVEWWSDEFAKILKAKKDEAAG